MCAALSRWSAVTYRVGFRTASGKVRSSRETIPPKGFTLADVAELAAAAGCDEEVVAMAAVGRAKSVAYVVGRQVASNEISFFEHFIGSHRGAKLNLPLPTTADVGFNEDQQQCRPETILCVCDGTRVADVLTADYDVTGHYCTGCRNDIRALRSAMAAEPDLLGRPADLQARVTAAGRAVPEHETI